MAHHDTTHHDTIDHDTTHDDTAHDDTARKLATKSLQAAADGDHEEAAALADRAADAGSLLGVALSTYLRTSRRGGVYDHPAAFEAFISGGGNVELYRRTSAALSMAYPGVGVLLDIGCGNGMALVPALRQSPTVPSVIDLVEPGAEMLDHALAAIRQSRLPVVSTSWPMGLTEFLIAAPPTQRWQLAQSTFALQSIEPGERAMALHNLATRVDRLVVVDFDVPDQRPRSRAHLESLAVRYERGLAEYDVTRDLVAQGFLMPVLLGQLIQGTPRTNWEHPARHWQEQVRAAGFTDVAVQPLADYWSANAFLLTATGATGRHAGSAPATV